MRAAVYARVSTVDQQPENQLEELRRYAAARGWEVKEYVDHGVSGAKERRPALDALVADAKRRRFDAVVCSRGQQAVATGAAMAVWASGSSAESRTWVCIVHTTRRRLHPGPSWLAGKST
jgi:predicted site-specific integrase-resolvase